MIKKVTIEQVEKGDVVLAGFPLDCNSSFMQGAAGGPASARTGLYSDSSNLCAENGVDLSEVDQLKDIGDINFGDELCQIDQIANVAEQITQRGGRLLSLGGDHSITFPLVKGICSTGKIFSLLHLDAHPDLYQDFDNNPNSHASPMARIMENNLVNEMIQIGIRTMNPHQQEQVNRFNVQVIQAKDWSIDKLPKINTSVYLSIDLDVLDPAFAPGVSHYEPGGLSTRQVIEIIHAIKAPIIGVDIVELNPSRDIHGMTAMVAGKLIKETAAKLVENNQESI